MLDGHLLYVQRELQTAYTALQTNPNERRKQRSWTVVECVKEGEKVVQTERLERDVEENLMNSMWATTRMRSLESSIGREMRHRYISGLVSFILKHVTHPPKKWFFHSGRFRAAQSPSIPFTPILPVQITTILASSGTLQVFVL